MCLSQAQQQKEISFLLRHKDQYHFYPAGLYPLESHLASAVAKKLCRKPHCLHAPPIRYLLRFAAVNDVERSEDGIHFSAIGNVAAYNTLGRHRYSLADVQPLKGISYYRLKQTGLDGGFVYSNIIVINRNSSETSITVFPNPV